MNARTRSRYEQLLRDVTSKAQQTKNQADCRDVLKTYTSFFEDSHVFVAWSQSSTKPMSTAQAYKNQTNLVELKPLNSEYVYIKLARFNQREVDKLDSLLRANAKLLASTPNLIFDLRGNGGGNASTSEEMIKVIYTNPVVYPAWDYRSSAERIKAAAKDLEANQRDTVANAFFYQRAKKLLRDLKTNPGAMIRNGEDLTRTIEVDPATTPQRIAFLIDKGCGSSTEFFVFEGKQSKKVTSFGTNTHGVMDYGEDQDFPLCDVTFSLAVPWGRNGWVRQFRIDNVGFTPDVKIPPTEKDWLGFVQRYYQRTAEK